MVLDQDRGRSLIRNLANHVRELVFGGGDPLIHENILEFVQLAKDCGLRVELHTNAVALNQLDVPKLFSALDRLGLSLDGETAQVHDAMRNAPGNFDAVMAALSLANDLGLPTTVRTLVSRKNCDHIQSIPHILNRYSSVDKWSVRQFVALGRGMRTRLTYQVDKNAFLNSVSEVRRSLENMSVRFQTGVITTDDMANCFCLIAEDGTFYGHPTYGNYKSIGKYPEDSVECILSHLAYDRSHRQSLVGM